MLILALTPLLESLIPIVAPSVVSIAVGAIASANIPALNRVFHYVRPYSKQIDTLAGLLLPHIDEKMGGHGSTFYQALDDSIREVISKESKFLPPKEQDLLTKAIISDETQRDLVHKVEEKFSPVAFSEVAAKYKHPLNVSSGADKEST